MPLAFVSISAAAEAASGDLTLTEPTGAADGDLIVACIAYRDSAAFTLPSGWTIVATQQSSGNTSTTTSTSIGSGLMAYIVRGSSAPSYVFTRTLGDVAIGRAVCYRGVDRSNPHDTGSANTLGANSATVTTGTITTAIDQELLVMAACYADNTTAATYLAATSPNKNYWHERADSNTITGADTGLGVAEAHQLTAGATGTLQYTAGNSSRHVCIVGAFRPATRTTTIQKVLETNRRSVDDASAFTTAAFTPPNNSLLVVATAANSVSGDIRNTMALTDSLGGTWTKQVQIGTIPGAQWHDHAIWTQPITTGASMTLTLDHATQTTRNMVITALAIVNYDKATPAGGTASVAPTGTTGAMTLSVAPRVGDITVISRKYDDSGSVDTSATPEVGYMELSENIIAISGGNTQIEMACRFDSTSTGVAWVNTNDLGGTVFDTSGLALVVRGSPSLPVFSNTPHFLPRRAA